MCTMYFYHGFSMVSYVILFFLINIHDIAKMHNIGDYLETNFAIINHKIHPSIFSSFL